MHSYLNPYSNQDFFGFFAVLLKRLFAFFSGSLSFENLATDEIQILVLGGLSASGALVGTFLVLRKMTMLANALSHTILLGIVAAFLVSMILAPTADPYQALTIPTLLIAAFITGIITTFLTELLTRAVRLQEDASIGLVFSLLFAIAIVLVTMFSRNVHIGTELIMGNADALNKRDLSLVFLILAMNFFLFLVFYKGYKITTFDPGLAKAFGYFPIFFNYLLMIQTSATAISAFKAVGVLMILAYLVIPTLTARLLANSLAKLIFLSIFIAVVGSLIGIALSRHILTTLGIGLSTGGIIVTMLGFFYFLVVVFAPRRGLLSRCFLKRNFSKNLARELK